MIMEENNDIFVAGGDALVYLAGTMHTKYFTTFVWGYSFSAYIFYDQSFTPTPVLSSLLTLVHICTHLE